ncbi:MAG: glycosyltransferase involved in cell wall biosynthesis [Candidatus Azotimanducaceae bacterium]|jgi:glycosyltransferase involved in cell wall biosynthesis
MKITYLAYVRFPSERAHGAQIAHMCNAFAHNNADVTLVVPYRKNGVVEDTSTYYGIPQSFKVLYTFCEPWSIGSKFGYFLGLFVFSIQAIFYLIKNKSDIVYSRDEIVLWFVSIFTPTKKIVWESHEAKFNFAARSLLKRGVKCVAISEGIKKFYVDTGVIEAQICVAHDGIDESFFGALESRETARARLGIATDKPVVMYIGGLDAWKGVDVLFETASTFSEVSFIAVGGTDAAIEMYAQKYPRVRFLGQRPYRELADNQQAGDILVCTNSSKNDLSAKYTSPLKLFSYMTSNVSLLAANVPSITSVVSEKEVFLYNPEDAKSVMESIKQIITNSGDARSRAVAAHELSKEFTWKKRAEKVLTFSRST